MAKYTKQKSGLYRTTIQLGYRPDGKPLKKYLSAPTIRELEQKIMEVRNDMANGLTISDATLWGAYARKWLSIYKANKSVQTQNMYLNALKHLQSLDMVPLKKVNRSMVQELINNNAEHPRICEVMLLTLKQIIKSAQNDGLVGKNPCTGIELPRHVRKERRALTDEEKKMLRSAVLQPIERLLLLVLYGVGCRPAEAFALTKQDIDLKNHCVHINKSVQYDGQYPISVSLPKTNASIRSVIVSAPILKAISRWMDKMPYDNIFAGENGKIMNKSQYEHIFRRTLMKAGLKDSGITMYTLRHNFCTECYYMGLSLKECQRQMGHSDYKMILEVYSHLDQVKENTFSKMSSMIM